MCYHGDKFQIWNSCMSDVYNGTIHRPITYNLLKLS